uniref:Uncharacterized protein n=1 Tax=Pithovirus LCPAC202 TaxID=2506592 RepID=A0A481Z7Q0_9VIRU|nr:MAG: hypothetical protein LCPAC202_01230 [Pithovirus LCPAC202]
MPVEKAVLTLTILIFCGSIGGSGWLSDIALPFQKDRFLLLIKYHFFIFRLFCKSED